MGEWRHFCKECQDPIPMNFKFCYHHKHLGKDNKKTNLLTIKNFASIERGCKDD